MKRFLCLLAILFSCSAVFSAYAGEVSVSAVLSKRSVQVHEEVRLTIRISGSRGNLQAPRLPGFQNFETFYTGRASHVTFINGQSSSSVEFNYVLVPQDAGQFTLDPIEVSVDGQRFRTDPLDIEVSGQAQSQPLPPAPSNASPASIPAQVPVQAPQPNFVPTDDNIFVRAWVDKNAVYPNEQVLLTYTLYTRYDTRYEGFEQEAEVSGFWIEEFPPERNVRRETVRLNGKQYVKADIKKVALFPTSAADYTIQPGTIKVSIRHEPRSTSVFDEFFNDSFFTGGSFFSRRENRVLKPPPIELQVKALPQAGQPDGFQGAVGNFRMQASLDKTKVAQNEPVTLTLVIEGEGNIETLNKPELPELPSFKIYDADTSSQLFKTGTVIGGKKTFEVVFIPKEAGSLKIPSLKFSYFNPASGSYKVLPTPEFSIEVTPSTQAFQMPQNLTQNEAFKKPIEVEGRDIRFIDERPPVKKHDRMRLYAIYTFLGANVLLTLLLVLASLRERQEKIYEQNQGLRRHRYARAEAEKKIRVIKRLSRSNDPKDHGAFYEEAGKVMTQYVSDKFNLSSYGLTEMDLENLLKDKIGQKDPLYSEIVDLYRTCGESRFARANVPKDIMNHAVKVLKQMIVRLEKVKS
ncbi:BatD family protein [Omnitrophica bacterium]|nr:BatD family protein [Candidatus Omnitrophota bacterium]